MKWMTLFVATLLATCSSARAQSYPVTHGPPQNGGYTTVQQFVIAPVYQQTGYGQHVFVGSIYVPVTAPQLVQQAVAQVTVAPVQQHYLPAQTAQQRAYFVPQTAAAHAAHSNGVNAESRELAGAIRGFDQSYGVGGHVARNDDGRVIAWKAPSGYRQPDPAGKLMADGSGRQSGGWQLRQDGPYEKPRWVEMPSLLQNTDIPAFPHASR